MNDQILGVQLAGVIQETIRNALPSNLERTADDGKLTHARLVNETSRKVYAVLPEDLMTLAGCGRSHAYHLMKRPDFPTSWSIARRRMCRMDDLISAIPHFGDPISGSDQ